MFQAQFVSAEIAPEEIICPLLSFFFGIVVWGGSFPFGAADVDVELIDHAILTSLARNAILKDGA